MMHEPAMSTIKRLTKEEADAIIEARKAKVRRARAERIERLEAEAQRMMQGLQGQDYLPDETPRRSSRSIWTTVKRPRSQSCKSCCNGLPSIPA
jgi:hypothetical protein